MRGREPSSGVIVAAVALTLFGGCDGPQSALTPAAPGAEALASLFWWMTGGALVIWVAVVSLSLYAAFSPREHPVSSTRWWVFGGGVAFPTVVLGVLLSYGLSLLPDLLAPPPEGSLRVAVVGKQWWWRVRYLPEGGPPVELANELRLPVGRPVVFELSTEDVIHSFWIPALGGKVDMIPGRSTRLVLTPTRVGVFRGACAEYCGGSHALMAFPVVVMEEEAFERWLASQAAPAQAPAVPVAARGQAHFLSNGCGACHAVRGTRANGVVGPDLTHVGSRLTLGAGTLPNAAESMRRWIARTEQVKPQVHMPAFGMLPPEELTAVAAYLEGLK